MRKTKSFALVLGVVLVLVAGSMASATSVFSRQAQDSHPGFAVPSTGTVLYSQLDDPTGNAFTDQDFEAVYQAYTATGADDFVVTAAVGWDISTLNTPGALVPASGQVPFFVSNAFKADAGGLPGATYPGCDFPGNTNFTTDGTGDLSIQVACNVPGANATSWVTQSVRLDFNPFGQHFWATRVNSVGNLGAWQNPGDGFLSGCTSWGTMDACAGGGVGLDFLFELLGKERLTVTQQTTITVPAVGPLGIGMMLLALGAGSAYVLRRRQA
jgi:hypothetical protein